jgi:ribosomal protein L32
LTKTKTNQLLICGPFFVGPKNNPFDLDVALIPICSPSSGTHNPSMADQFDGILWAVQKTRRSVERRLKRKFGDCKLISNSKMLKLRHDLTICQSCGSWHELNFICAVCYKKVKEETRKVQKSIVEALGLSPVEREVEVKYQNETPKHSERLLVEIDEPRPNWFSQNLLARSGSQISSEKKLATDENLIVQTK